MGDSKKEIGKDVSGRETGATSSANER